MVTPIDLATGQGRYTNHGWLPDESRRVSFHGKTAPVWVGLEDAGTGIDLLKLSPEVSA